MGKTPIRKYLGFELVASEPIMIYTGHEVTSFLLDYNEPDHFHPQPLSFGDKLYLVKVVKDSKGRLMTIFTPYRNSPTRFLVYGVIQCVLANINNVKLVNEVNRYKEQLNETEGKIRNLTTELDNEKTMKRSIQGCISERIMGIKKKQVNWSKYTGAM